MSAEKPIIMTWPEHQRHQSVKKRSEEIATAGRKPTRNRLGKDWRDVCAYREADDDASGKDEVPPPANLRRASVAVVADDGLHLPA